MCDTLAAVAGATATGGVLFAKNSDRERNEAQVLELIPRRTGDPEGRVRLTYIDIPDAAQSHACLLSRPFWMWGAEMGANERGVVIGNEAMHSHVGASRRRALTGMDLVRLGLERAASAREAVEVITTLLETHGQGGDCGHLRRFYYHNGFMIADPAEAYVLETVGRWWAVERVQDVRALSNALSIGHPERASAALAQHAAEQGWADDDARFHFADRLIDLDRDAVSFGRGRCARGDALLRARLGRLEVADMAAILRDHGAEAEDDPNWTPDRTLVRSICMHATHGARISQTVASMVSDLSGDVAVHWVTGTSAPCLSLFKPVVIGADLPAAARPSPTDRFDAETMWWRHERLHRLALKDLPAALAALPPERDALEARFRQRMDQALAAGDESLAGAVRACWWEAEAFERAWTQTIACHAPQGQRRMQPATARAWGRLNLAAALPRA